MNAELLAVVFDLDGTLVDSRADIITAVNATLAASGEAPLGAEEIAGFVGDGARMLLARAFRRRPDDPALDGVLDAFLRYYTDHAADHTRLMPGALEALNGLADMPLAVCTNKPRAPTEHLLRALGLAYRFRVVVAGGDLAANKPDPAPLFHIARELGVAAASLCVVGDGVQDVQAGLAAGARTVAVLGGFGAADRLRAAGPDAVLEDLTELPAYVRGRTGRQATRA